MKPVLFSILLAMVFFAAWKQWRKGLRMKIGFGLLSIKTPIELAFPIANIAHISIDPKGTLRFTLYDENNSSPESAASRLKGNFSRFGWNLEISGVGLTTARELCKAVNTVPEEIPAELAAELSSNRMDSFQQSLIKNHPYIFATWLLLAGNFGFFAWISFNGVSPWQPELPNLITWGANYAPLTAQGEAWRLLSSIFLHLGMVHLLMNMFVLWRLGPLLERMLGSVPFAITWFLTGLAGSEASLYWNEMRVSAGASGALFGMIGCLLGYLLGRPRSIPQEILRQFRSMAITLLLFNFLFMAFLEGIDQAAHAGGALAGIACGVFLGMPYGTHPRFSRYLRNCSLAAVGGFFLWSCWVPLQAKVVRDSALVLRFEQFQKEEFPLLEKLNQYSQAQNRGEIARGELAMKVEVEILPRWREFHDWFADPPKVPTHFQPWFADFQKYLQLRQEAMELLIQALRGNDFLLMKRSNARAEEASRLVEKINRDIKEKDR